MDKIKVAAVDYLNTKPLIYGVKKRAEELNINLVEAYPAIVAQMLIEGSVDLGLVPVAIIPKLSESHIITNYCIGCEGPVASVCIFSEVPMEEIETIYLDYQSRTSVQLAKTLLREYWKSEAQLIDAAGEDYLHQIKGATAGVVIGDRALRQRLTAKYIYDLGEAWMAHTRLPFVFAAWVSNKQLPVAFIEAFDKANAVGFAHLPDVIAENVYENYDLETYYTKNISYHLTNEKRKGLALFLGKMKVSS